MLTLIEKRSIPPKTLLAVALLWWCLLLTSMAVANSLPEPSVGQRWFVDETAGLTAPEALQRFANGASQPLTQDVFRLGNQLRQVWIRQQVSNQSGTSVSRRLLLESPYTAYFHASLWSDSLPSPISLLEDSDQQPFSARNNSFRFLNSEPFTLAAGEVATILIQTRFDGPTFLRTRLLSEAEFHTLRLQDGVIAALFYGISLTVALLFLLLSLAARQPIGLMFAGLFLLGLLALADVDGYALRFFWPDYPQLETWMPLIVLPLLNALGFMTCRQIIRAIDPGKWLMLQVAALVLTGLTLVLPLLLPFFLLPTLVQTELMLTMLMFFLLPLAFISWLGRQRRNRLLWGFLVLVSGAVLLMAASMLFFELALPVVLTRYFHYLVFLLISLAVMGSMTIHIMGMSRDQQNAIRRELAYSRREADMNRTLFKSEQAYAAARELAQSRQQQLAKASHDIRQPLTSLRSTLDVVIREQSPEIRQQLRGSLDYMEQLCSNYLSKNRGQSASAPAPETVVEAYPINLILSNVQRMFADEARATGIEIRRVACHASLTVPSLAMMRMVSNLLANAIKHHTSASRPRVLLGCRRRGEQLRIMVCDNSRGMSEPEIADLLKPYHKGKNSAGEGLGLAIIQQLAAEHGLGFEISSVPRCGSCFVLVVPTVLLQC